MHFTNILKISIITSVLVISGTNTAEGSSTGEQYNPKFMTFVLKLNDIKSMCQDEDSALLFQASSPIKENPMRSNFTNDIGSQRWIDLKKHNNEPSEEENEIRIEINKASLKMPLVDVFCVKEDNVVLEPDEIRNGRCTNKWTVGPVRTKLNETEKMELTTVSHYVNTTEGIPFNKLVWESFPYEENIFMVSNGDDDRNNIMYSNYTTHFRCKTAYSTEHLILSNLTFWMQLANGTKFMLVHDPSNFVEIQLDSRAFLKFKTWRLGIQLPLDAVAISCQVPFDRHPTLYLGAVRHFKTKYVEYPEIKKDPSALENTFYTGETHKTLTCDSKGEPRPYFIWKKDDLNLDASPHLKSLRLRQTIGNNEESIVEFPAITKEHEGKYSCEASNKLGSDLTEFNVYVKEGSERPSGHSTGTILMIIFLIISALLISGFGLYRYYRAKKIMRGLTMEELETELGRDSVRPLF